MSFDFPVKGSIMVGSPEDLRDALCSLDRVRLIGSGSAQLRIPAPADQEPVTTVSCAPMNRILRFEPDDLTCSVQPGVRRSDLDAELTKHKLCLPAAGQGTLGGMFAADEHGSQGPGQPEPRHLLLGMNALLAEGKAFASGARVVKNVAGFDLQKLFVGSRGRLFAATELHLKLRPMPRGTLHFICADRSPSETLELLGQLRNHPSRPSELHFFRSAQGSCSLQGTLVGEPRYLDERARELGVQAVEATEAPRLTNPPPTNEILRGIVRFGRLAELLEALPAGAEFALHGERFEASLERGATDTWLTQLPSLGAAAEICESNTDRRGQRTPGDPTADRLSAQLTLALDPGRVLR